MCEHEPTPAELASLRERIRPYLTEKRYAHTLAVEGEAAYMAKLLLPEREGSIRAAALLHDIAKKLSFEMQLNYIREFDIMEADKTPVMDVAHAFAGAAMVMKHFPDFADRDIVSAVKNHATGRPGMTVFDAIIFLADYIEPTRTHESCRELHDIFHANMNEARTPDERIAVLRGGTVEAMRRTVSYVTGCGGELDTATLDAIAYFEGGGGLR